MSELVHHEIAANGVATITLRHGKVNALSLAVLSDLAEAVGAISEPQSGVRCVVITGGPKIFAAGADVTGFTAGDADAFALAPPARVREIGEAFLHTLSAVAAIPVPTIASVSGFALGGGLELALSCDLRIASTAARFGLPEILLGIIPGGGGTQRLARLVGPGVAKELLFTGRQVRADEALRLGIVNSVVEPDDLVTATTEMADRLAAGAPNALALAKSAIDAGLSAPLAEGLLIEHERFVTVFGTPDAAVGVESFLVSGPGHADFGSIR